MGRIEDLRKYDFDNWGFSKGQSVMYKDESYDLLGVNFSNSTVKVKINNKTVWLSYKEIDLLPF